MYSGSLERLVYILQIRLSPGLSCELMLKLAAVVSNLMSDTNMFLFTGKGMRGGVSCIELKYSIKINIEYKYIHI